MIKIHGKQEVGLKEDVDGNPVITPNGDDDMVVGPGEVVVMVTGTGLKKEEMCFVHRINEKPVDMGTLTGVVIALIAVGKPVIEPAVEKDGE